LKSALNLAFQRLVSINRDSEQNFSTKLPITQFLDQTESHRLFFINMS